MLMSQKRGTLMYPKEISESSIAINDVLTKLQLLQKQAENNFSSYARTIYLSKVQSRFPHLFTPTYDGCFIKIKHSYLEDDSAFIDLEQALVIKLHEQQQILWSTLADRILPFDVVGTQCVNDSIELVFASKVGAFTLIGGNFSVWLNPDNIPIENTVAIFYYLTKSLDSRISVEPDHGETYEIPVTLTFGHHYAQHFNHQLRQNTADPRLQFRINVGLSKKIKGKIRSITLTLEPFSCGDNFKGNLVKAFHTNIFPMANQRYMLSDSFIMDGDHDVYWFGVEKDHDTPFMLHEVLTVYADQKKLDTLDYKIIYQANKVGVEFNNISKVLHKSICADVYISCGVNKSLMDGHRNASVKWFSQSLDTYQLKVLNLFLTSEQVSSQYNVEKLFAILEIPNIHQWRLQEWKSLLKLSDISAVIPINHFLDEVVLSQDHNVKLYFKNVPELKRYWVCFYLKHLEKFIVKNSHHLIKIQGVF